MTVSGVANGSVKSTIEAAVESEREPKARRRGIDYQPKERFQEPPLLEAVFTYISYGLLIIVGHIMDFLRRVGLKSSGPGYTEALKKDVSTVANVHVYTPRSFCGFSSGLGVARFGLWSMLAKTHPNVRILANNFVSDRRPCCSNSH